MEVEEDGTVEWLHDDNDMAMESASTYQRVSPRRRTARCGTVARAAGTKASSYKQFSEAVGESV